MIASGGCERSLENRERDLTSRYSMGRARENGGRERMQDENEGKAHLEIILYILILSIN